MPEEHLLTVTDAFEIRGRGLVVMPAIPAAKFTGAVAREVELRFPDGATQTVSAHFDIPRTAKMDPQNLTFVCMLRGLQKNDVPIGTEVWWRP